MIPAKYIIANNFSNGLACVREKGRYGYINLKGGYSIPPKYDFAYPFVEGFAIVYIKGRPSFINLKGENLLIGKYKQINNFKNGYAFVKTWSGKVGIVNKKGELIVDTIYSQFRETTEGNYIVTKWISPDSNFTIENRNAIFDEAVINKAGKIIIPFGKYNKIFFEMESQYIVNIIDSENIDNFYLINTNGKNYYRIFRNKFNEIISDRNDSSNLLVLNILKFLSKNDKSNNWEYLIFKDYLARYICNCNNATEVNYLSDRFISLSFGFIDTKYFRFYQNKFIEIDKMKGFPIKSENPDHLFYFDSSRCIIIDKVSGEPLSNIESDDRPVFVEELQIYIYTLRRNANARIYGESISGIMDKNCKTIKDTFIDLQYKYNVGKYTYWSDYNKEVWLDAKFNKIWEAHVQNSLSEIDTDRKIYLKNYAKEAIVNDNDSILFFDDTAFAENDSMKVLIIVNQFCINSYNGMPGIEVNVINKSLEYYYSNLNVVDNLSLEAKDENGKWVDITLYNIGCVRSDYTLENWTKNKSAKFTMPRPIGEYQTKFRFKFNSALVDRFHSDYSAEFSGGINPAVYWHAYDYDFDINYPQPSLNFQENKVIE